MNALTCFQRDRHPQDCDSVLNLRKVSEDDGQNEPERALNFLQQLDGKLAILSKERDNLPKSCYFYRHLFCLDRIEEAACKRIADLEAELQRVAESEKRSISRADELERQYQQHQLLLQVNEYILTCFSLSNFS